MAVEPIQVRFGDRVRELRTTAGLTQEALAVKSKLSRHYMSELECGKRNPTLGVIDRVAVALGVSPAEVMPQ